MSWRDVVIKNYNNDEYSQYRDAMSRVQKLAIVAVANKW